MHIMLPDCLIDRVSALGARHHVTPMEVLERAIALAERLDQLADTGADTPTDVLDVDYRTHRARRMTLFTVNGNGGEGL